MTVSRIPNVEGGIQPTIVTAKGDLIAAVANASPGRLGVGSDGTVLTADSSSATGLSYQNNWAAGKNKIINGDFSVNQRNFTSVTSSLSFGFDRWSITFTGGTVTYSAQTFTAGQAPVAGYEAINFSRLATSGQSAVSDRSILNQRIEDVRTLSGQTATVSFWAKASTGTPSVSVELLQSFGSGGSASVTAGVSKIEITSSWARYTATIAVPSVSGKTIGSGSNLVCILWTSAGSDFNARSASLGIQNATIDFWGVQVEAGSVATAFQTATGTIQGELAACQRYYYRATAQTTSFYISTGTGFARNTTIAYIPSFVPVTMRAISSLDFSGIRAVRASTDVGYNSGTFAFTGNYTSNIAELSYTHGSAVFTQGEVIYLGNNNANPSYIGLNGEL